MLLKLIVVFLIANGLASIAWIDPTYSETLTNGKWTVTIDNEESWQGINGTGNLSYYGCNNRCDCTYLTGGTVSCRDGVCQTIWNNGNYNYILSSPITEKREELNSTLTIWLNGKKILSATGFNLLPFDNLPQKRSLF